jgi:hypothetical protein
MSAKFKESQWNELIDILKKYNIDFDQRIKDLIPEEPKTVPGLPTRSPPKSVSSMKVVVDDEQLASPKDKRNDL